MPRKIKDVTKDYLVNVGLPNHGQTYTVISHQSIIDYAYAELANQGFGIVDEEYRSTHDGQIAQGIYKLQYGTDPEMNLMFAWTNSYNKQIRFKCATGGYVANNRTVMLAGDMGSYARKHTGTADADVIASMQSQITNAMMYYNQLVADKEVMKTIELSIRKQAELLGILFAEHEILTTEQASTIRQQMDKPSYFYNGGKDTLWAFYNHCTVALQQSHPRTWMEDQRMLHWVISNEFDLSTPATAATMIALVDPLENNYGEPENQTNLLVQIAEIEAQHPVTPEDAFIAEKVVQYTDSAGNTFEAPFIEEEPSLIEDEEIAIAIKRVERKELKEMLKAADEAVSEPEPEIDESTLTPFQRMQLRLEKANKRIETEVESVEEEEEVPVQETSTVTSLLLTPEEMEEHKEELNQLEAELEVPSVNTTETKVVKDDNFEDFTFDLSSDDEDTEFGDDFL